jgi:cellulase-like Ig domain-containing protein
MTNRRRAFTLAGAATAAVAAVTLATSAAPALGNPRDLSAVSGVIAPKTVNKAPEVRVNQVGYPTGAPKVAFAMLPTKVAAYEDNVVSWPSVEPADDYTANSLLAFALGGAGLG